MFGLACFTPWFEQLQAREFRAHRRLFFKDDRTGDVEEIKRTKNSEGVVDRLHVLDDIDKETYETMFALNSDELLKLDRHNEVTARLLTAGSGTASSPPSCC